MTRDQVLELLKKRLFEALKLYGKHTYYDRGAVDLIHLQPCVEWLQGLESVSDRAWVLSQLGAEVHGMIFANELFFLLYDRYNDEALQSELLKYPNGTEVGEY